MSNSFLCVTISQKAEDKLLRVWGSHHAGGDVQTLRSLDFGETGRLWSLVFQIPQHGVMIITRTQGRYLSIQMGLRGKC